MAYPNGNRLNPSPLKFGDIEQYVNVMQAFSSYELPSFNIVSPLGPLTESLVKSHSKMQDETESNVNKKSRDLELRDTLSKASTSTTVKLPDTLKECKPLNTLEVLEALNSPLNQASVTFQHDPLHGIERFKLISIQNVLPVNELPVLYLYGRAAFYESSWDDGPVKYLTVRYEGVTKRYLIGKAVVDKKELAWIIRTMKIAGSCLVNVNKKIKKVSSKAGKTFTVNI